MYRNQESKWTKHADFSILDILCMFAAVLLGMLTQKGRIDFSHQSISLLLMYLVCNVLSNVVRQNYKDILQRKWAIELRSCFMQVVLVNLFLLALLFGLKISAQHSRLQIAYSAGYYLVITWVVRQGYKRFLRNWGRKGRHTNSLLIVTHSGRLQELPESMRKNGYANFSVKGIVVLDKDMVGQEYCSIPIVASGESVVEYICRNWVDEVFLNVLEIEDEKITLLRGDLLDMGITVHERLFLGSEENSSMYRVGSVGNYTVLTSSVKYAAPFELFLKRCLDIVGGLCGCLVTLILSLFLAPAICIKSPGPLFFKQERIGKNGRTFKMYKFRSMYMDAEERKKELMSQNRVSDGMMFKLDFDPRVIGNEILPDGTRKTGIGQFIRDSSLDEFPQFFNILKGEMSLVGTRPPTLDEWEKYELHHRSRMATKPGLTGMWQVSGRSEITDFEEVVRLDREYIRNWSIGLDIKILLKTVGVVLKRKGSM